MENDAAGTRRRKSKSRKLVAGLSIEALSSICLVAADECGVTLPPSFMQYDTKKKDVHKGKVIARIRRSVRSVMYELGEDLSRRYFRMDKEAFFKLHGILKGHIDKHRKKSTRVPPNGFISSETRLAAALRYFAGGSALDIALVFGINHWDVFRSVWMIVDAINETKDLAISFPRIHSKQKEIAKEFQQNSAINIDNCVGAIDGMLVWIQQPTKVDCDEMKIGPKKFYCGRKKKFAMNLQAVCDAKRRFLDICIRQPGSTSDYLTFRTSSIFHDIETKGFLCNGLALYGDNAYVSNEYMVTPFRAVSSGPKDAFNYYQSQVRIAIECAFGMLVHRWGILRKAIPVGISIAKTCALVVALCKLHNFCIDQRQPEVNMAAQDEFNVAAAGGIPLDRTNDNETRPSQLLDGNERATEDFDRATLVREQRRARRLVETLPRDKVLNIVQENNLQRVLPLNWLQNHNK